MAFVSGSLVLTTSSRTSSSSSRKGCRIQMGYTGKHARRFMFERSVAEAAVMDRAVDESTMLGAEENTFGKLPEEYNTVGAKMLNLPGVRIDPEDCLPGTVQMLPSVVLPSAFAKVPAVGGTLSFSAVADEFFARSVTRQFKEMVNASGVYDPQCTEGTTKQEAWIKREAALSAQFRAKQRSVAEQAGDFFENRRMAINMIGHICSAEEWKFRLFPKLAEAYAMGKMEAMRTCTRYALPESIEEAYMVSVVDAQNKKRGAPNGVYSSSCVEGNAKGRAEAARSAALDTAFRAGWKSASQVTGDRYRLAAYGRNIFAHGCSYEEDVFNKYPAVAGAMRSKSYRK